MDYLEEIEAYLNDELLDDEKREFEAELARNADLRRSVAEYRLLFELMGNDKPTRPQTEDAAETQRLQGVFMSSFKDLPLAEPQKGENIRELNPDTIGTDLSRDYRKGVKVVPLEANPTKKKPLFPMWAIAASVALLATAGIWIYQKSKTPEPIVAQTQPTLTVPIDTVTKNNVKMPDKVVTVETQHPPQYPTTKKVEKVTEQGKPTRTTTNPQAKTEELISNEQVFAAVETALDKAVVETKGNGSDDIVKALRSKNADKAIELSENLREIDYLKERGEFYLALAHLLKNKKEGLARLNSIAANNEHKFKQNAADLLKKLKQR